MGAEVRATNPFRSTSFKCKMMEPGPNWRSKKKREGKVEEWGRYFRGMSDRGLLSCVLNVSGFVWDPRIRGPLMMNLGKWNGMVNWLGTKAGLNLNYRSDFYRLPHSLSIFSYKMGLLIPTSASEATEFPWTTLRKKESLQKYKQISLKVGSCSKWSLQISALLSMAQTISLT